MKMLIALAFGSLTFLCFGQSSTVQIESSNVVAGEITESLAAKACDGDISEIWLALSRVGEAHNDGISESNLCGDQGVNITAFETLSLSSNYIDMIEAPKLALSFRFSDTIPFKGRFIS